jgi:hypothetical protein
MTKSPKAASVVVSALKQRLEELKNHHADDSDISEMPADRKTKVRAGGVN